VFAVDVAAAVDGESFRGGFGFSANFAVEGDCAGGFSREPFPFAKGGVCGNEIEDTEIIVVLGVGEVDDVDRFGSTVVWVHGDDV